MYSKPTEDSEVGFLIRKSAGNAVARNRTRRLFWGLISNRTLTLPSNEGCLFLFHRSFRETDELEGALQRILGVPA